MMFSGAYVACVGHEENANGCVAMFMYHRDGDPNQEVQILQHDAMREVDGLTLHGCLDVPDYLISTHLDIQQMSQD